MPVYIRILKPSKTATSCPNSAPNCPKGSKCHNCPNSDTICLKIVQILPIIFLRVPQIAPKMPQIAPIVPPIVPNVPKKC